MAQLHGGGAASNVHSCQSTGAAAARLTRRAANRAEKVAAALLLTHAPQYVLEIFSGGIEPKALRRSARFQRRTPLLWWLVLVCGACFAILVCALHALPPHSG